MPKWLAIAHMVVEAETQEEANTLVAANVAERLRAAQDEHQDTARMPRYTVIHVERFPDYTDRSSPQHG